MSIRRAARPALAALVPVLTLGLLLGPTSEALAAAPPRLAVPVDGPGADTPGTSASVSPRRLSAGSVISYRVTGFPAGEVVYVKIDDGEFCSDSGVHGACVVTQQRIPASGSVSGSLTLPADLKPGAHWLRFLASQEIYADDGTYQGIKGYTARGNSDLTVVAASSSGPATASAAATSGASATAAATSGASATTAEQDETGGAVVAPAGATLTVAPVEGEADESGAASSTPAATVTVVPEVVVEAAPAAAASRRLPVVGLAGLLLLAVLGALALRGRRHG